MNGPQAYIDEMARKRGYVLDYHKAMASADFDVLVATNDLVESVYLQPRLLDRQTKELIFIVSLVVLRASKEHIQGHIRVALRLGVSPREILEAIEITLPEAGVIVFQEGIDAWREAVNAEYLEPSEEALASFDRQPETELPGDAVDTALVQEESDSEADQSA